MKNTSLVINLPKKHQVVFAALTCEKLLYIIHEYDKYERNKGADLYIESISMLYSFALGHPSRIDEYIRLKAAIESLCPDLDESKNPFASYGLDAYISIVEVFLFIIENDSEHIINCATLATDTVDMYVQMVSEDEPPAMPELDAFIASNAYMIKEISRQVIIAKSLSEMPVIDASGIKKLRLLNGEENIVDLALL